MPKADIGGFETEMDLLGPVATGPVATWSEDIHGTFEGRVDSFSEAWWRFACTSCKGFVDQPVEILIYGPARLPWWKAWAYRVAGLFGVDWPQEVIASGKAYTDATVYHDGLGPVIKGTFRSDGTWTIEED